MSPDDLTGEQAEQQSDLVMMLKRFPGDKLEGSLHEVETATLSPDGEIVKQAMKGA